MMARRGSALILVLLMTLAVAGLAVAAIFLSSSAGLLSRYYDTEREYQLAAESALEVIRSRLARDTMLAIPDTGMVQLLAGYQPVDATGATLTRASVNVYAAATGDTTGLAVPHVTLLAAAYDANGTRHVRRVDLARESFSHYGLFAHTFGATLVFGPGSVGGRVHTNQTWRTGAGTFAATYLDSVTAVVALTGTGTYHEDTVSGVPRVPYPSDSTYLRLDTLAILGNLSFAPVAASGAGWRTGTRLEFVAVDADGDGASEADEGFARVFDLANNMDTTRLSVGLPATDVYGLFALAKRWSDPVVQNQCGAFYYRGSRWQFFPVSTHRASWAQTIIQATGHPNIPAVTEPEMWQMDDYDYEAAQLVLSQQTARCFPAGSPYLMPAERFTNASGVVTGGPADTYPFGTAPTSWSAGTRYGGSDTTFTPRSRTCTVGFSGGTCADAAVTLGRWRAFAGTAVTGIPTSIRQAGELPYLWPLSPPRNTTSRRVIHASSGPLFVSGEVRGNVLLHVDGAVRVISRLTYQEPPTEADPDVCRDQLGVLAVGDILVSDNALTRGRRVVDGGLFNFANFTTMLSAEPELRLHGSFMSVTGTVGVENASVAGIVPQSCPSGASANSSGGCLSIIGAMVMRTYSEIHGNGSSGFRYAGVKDPCQTTRRRPPYFPLTNRYAPVRTLEIEPSLANTPAKVRAILMRLKGRTL